MKGTRVRQIIGFILGIVTVPVLVLGLIDPLEGGVALIVAAVLIGGTRLIARVPIPRIEWIGWLVAMVVGVLAITWAVLARVTQNQTPGGLEGLPWGVIVSLVIYEVAVLMTVAGGVQYAVRLGKTLHRGGTLRHH